MQQGRLLEEQPLRFQGYPDLEAGLLQALQAVLPVALLQVLATHGHKAQALVKDLWQELAPVLKVV